MRWNELLGLSQQAEYNFMRGNTREDPRKVYGGRRVVKQQNQLTTLKSVPSEDSLLIASCTSDSSRAPVVQSEVFSERATSNQKATRKANQKAD